MAYANIEKAVVPCPDQESAEEYAVCPQIRASDLWIGALTSEKS